MGASSATNRSSSYSSSPPLAKIRTSGSPRVVQEAASFPREGDQVAAVEADAKRSAQAAVADDLDDGGDAAQGFVGVDEEGGALGQVLGEAAKGALLAREGLDVGVRHGAGRSEPASAGRLHIAGGNDAGDGGEAGDRHAGVDAVGPAQGEVDQVDVAGGQAAAGRLGCHGRLEGDLIPIQQVRLHQLGLGDGARDFDDGLVRQDDPSLGDGVHVASQAQASTMSAGKPGAGQPGEDLDQLLDPVFDGVLAPGAQNNGGRALGIAPGIRSQV